MSRNLPNAGEVGAVMFVKFNSSHGLAVYPISKSAAGDHMNLLANLILILIRLIRQEILILILILFDIDID